MSRMFDAAGREKMRPYQQDDEFQYWTDQAALLDPAAYVHLLSSSFSFTVTTGEIWYLLNAWNARLGGAGGDFFLRDPSRPMAMPGGFNLQGNGTANAFAYYCRPSLVSSGSKYADPKALYYERLRRLRHLQLNEIFVTSAAAAGSTPTYNAFPTDFTNGLILGAQTFDNAWVILAQSTSVGTCNLGHEISDSHEFRMAQGMTLPFVRTTHTGVSGQPASVSGTGTNIAGNVSVMYVKLPSDW